jgi:hypothetical protein
MTIGFDNSTCHSAASFRLPMDNARAATGVCQVVDYG